MGGFTVIPRARPVRGRAHAGSGPRAPASAGGARTGRRGRGRVTVARLLHRLGMFSARRSAGDDRRLGAPGRRGLRRGRDVRVADQQRPLPARHRQPVRQGPARGEVPAPAERREPDRLRRLAGQAHRPGRQAGDQRLRQGDQAAAPRLQRHQPAEQRRADGRPAVEGQADGVRAGPDGRLLGRPHHRARPERHGRHGARHRGRDHHRSRRRRSVRRSPTSRPRSARSSASSPR